MPPEVEMVRQLGHEAWVRQAQAPSCASAAVEKPEVRAMSAFEDIGAIGPCGSGTTSWPGRSTAAVDAGRGRAGAGRASSPSTTTRTSSSGWVIQGSVELPRRRRGAELGPGATWNIPSDVPHEVGAGPEGAVVIDVFSPGTGGPTGRASREEPRTPPGPEPLPPPDTGGRLRSVARPVRRCAAVASPRGQRRGGERITMTRPIHGPRAALGVRMLIGSFRAVGNLAAWPSGLPVSSTQRRQRRVTGDVSNGGMHVTRRRRSDPTRASRRREMRKTSAANASRPETTGEPRRGSRRSRLASVPGPATHRSRREDDPSGIHGSDPVGDRTTSRSTFALLSATMMMSCVGAASWQAMARGAPSLGRRQSQPRVSLIERGGRTLSEAGVASGSTFLLEQSILSEPDAAAAPRRG